MGEPDVESTLREWLAGQFPMARVVTETPADLEQIPFVVAVARAGGGKQFTIAHPRVVLSSFAIASDGKSARANARALAYQVDDAMCWQLRRTQLGGRYVARVEQTSGPSFSDYTNPLVRLFVATYSISFN